MHRQPYYVANKIDENKLDQLDMEPTLFKYN